MNTETSLDPKIKEAINAALENNWKLALDLNLELTTKYPNDIDTLNRLAKSYTETGNITEAKKNYKKVLELDPYNKIASKNLSRVSTINPSDLKDTKLQSSLKGDVFLEEPGKTKNTLLEDTAMIKVLATLRTGDNVLLQPLRNTITILSLGGDRIGKLENSLGERLIQDIKYGSKFDAIIRSVEINQNSKTNSPKVSVFLREISRASKVSTPPFPITSTGFTPYVREEAMNILSNQSPVLTEADDNVEEVEVSSLQISENETRDIENLQEKELDEDQDLD